MYIASVILPTPFNMVKVIESLSGSVAYPFRSKVSVSPSFTLWLFISIIGALFVVEKFHTAPSVSPPRASLASTFQ